jgi:dihydroorotate dehydrogenase (NAD+) catalytic subunit
MNAFGWHGPATLKRAGIKKSVNSGAYAQISNLKSKISNHQSAIMDLLPLRSPILNAAGTLGFAPNPRGSVDLARLGAFVTNPISLKPRHPAAARCLLPFSGGFLLHSGFPNPGFRKVVELYAGRWVKSLLPVIVHLMADQPEELVSMVRRLEEMEGVVGVEIGLRPESSSEEAQELAQAAFGELPVIVQVPPENLENLLPRLRGLEIAAISLAAPRGMLPSGDGGLARGRLFGPGLLPAALAAVQAAVGFGLPVIGSGGVYSEADVQAMLAAGAQAVQLDAVLWRGEDFIREFRE